ncbi:tRNA-dihydrouridine synthase family protein [Dethiosulfovibrio sp. F2B]|uniref:tRNA dihydrouridine synthase n=1 Tax=Dethiosulfovibrio faecalis TaxID=2720018 RepID=UPI001F2B09C6|nr:tRNA-dihydrouridine synthase family protein [Dethiosulfovibrio faecalis]MCF4150828.1 tRNA-dihydrouridine synthase family protein [Dethiosulfovibrio faecalis]
MTGSLRPGMVGPSVLVGGLELSNPIMMAPMAGVTLPAVRRMFWRLGAGLAHTEMVSCAGLTRKNRKTTEMLFRAPGEGPLVLQLFAGDSDTLMRGAEIALSLGVPFDALGINMACPMPKVLKKGAGARLLSRLDLAVDMVRCLGRLGLPVWPKIRKIVPDGSGPDTLEFASALVEAGAANVGVHGRTASQRYEGTSDFDEVCRVARALPGVISASGDISGPEDVSKALSGGCVSVFLARGGVTDPFVLPRILSHLGYNIGDPVYDDPPSIETRAALFSDLAEDLSNFHGERVAMVLLKRLMSGVFRGVPGCSSYRRAIASASDWGTMCVHIRDWRHFFERGIKDE